MKNLILGLFFASVLGASPLMTSFEPTPHANEVSLNDILDNFVGSGNWYQLPDPRVFHEDTLFLETIASYAGATQSFQWVAVDGGKLRVILQQDIRALEQCAQIL